MPRAANAFGSTCTRTAYFWAPKTRTCATPVRLEMRCASSVSAYSSTADSGRLAELSARNSTGESAGLTLRNEGGVVISAGSRRAAVLIADCTSSAAPSMSRSRSNWSVIRVEPSPLLEVIEPIPAMVANWRSSGVATDAAMVSGLAPGRLAVTWIVGKSTRGSAATGSRR